MDFGTNLTEFMPVPLTDGEADAANITSDFRESAWSKRGTFSPVVTSANTLPEAILGSWSRIGRAAMSVKMYNNLVRIAMQPAGWRGPASAALRPASLKNFLEFWSMVSSVAHEPELALAPDGTLYAEWFSSPRQRLDVRFLDQKIVFGLFANNSILEGAEDRNTVANILTSHRAGPLRWGR